MTKAALALGYLPTLIMLHDALRRYGELTAAYGQLEDTPA